MVGSQVRIRHCSGTIDGMGWAGEHRIFALRGCTTNATTLQPCEKDAGRRTLAIRSRAPRRLAPAVEENNFHWGVSGKPLLDAAATRGAGIWTDGRVRGRYKNGVEIVLCKVMD